MYGSERPMRPVLCIAAKDLWDRSHAWLLDKHGTGPIGQLGLHIMTWFWVFFLSNMKNLNMDLSFSALIFNITLRSRFTSKQKNCETHNRGEWFLLFSTL